MKKKLIITLAMLLFGILLLSGCGKTEEQKAQDEIMSHMSDDEKEAIADDQKAIADYEAEKQAQADAIANEQPIDYSEVLEEKPLSDITFENSDVINIPISVLLPGDEYLYSGKGYDIERDVSRGMFNYGQNQLAVSENFAVVSIKDVSGDSEDCGNYTIYVQTANSSIGAYYLFVTENDSEYALQIVVTAAIKDYYDCAEEMFNKSYQYIKEQL